jgi:hypothetical protein
MTHDSSVVSLLLIVAAIVVLFGVVKISRAARPSHGRPWIYPTLSRSLSMKRTMLMALSARQK